MFLKKYPYTEVHINQINPFMSNKNKLGHFYGTIVKTLKIRNF